MDPCVPPTLDPGEPYAPGVEAGVPRCALAVSGAVGGWILRIGDGDPY